MTATIRPRYVIEKRTRREMYALQGERFADRMRKVVRYFARPVGDAPRIDRPFKTAKELRAHVAAAGGRVVRIIAGVPR